jgi:hypothetical protein
MKVDAVQSGSVAATSTIDNRPSVPLSANQSPHSMQCGAARPQCDFTKTVVLIHGWMQHWNLSSPALLRESVSVPPG